MEKNENKNKPSTWNILSKINCNEHVEEKKRNRTCFFL